ncbi:hypothetical protein ACIRQP_12365 [Streptomyces sp. NPDC102274]|uniref:hypothetical protein n=1 Tax=Streptomyces sp. NPDC102274 TaxID=3366151 RepID=UPI0037F8C899
MADRQFSDAPRRAHTAPHPMANPGYGKRSAVGQPAPTADDFVLLPDREAAVASFIDRLPDGADVSVKALAKVMEYGQCALRTALNFLQRAGYLFRKREFLVGPAGARWVTRTWFSRAARDDASWAAYASGGEVPGHVSQADTAPAPAPPAASRPARLPDRSRAYAVLASVGRRNPAVSLSAADCAALESLAAEWFVRGATEEDVLRALTDGLPLPVHHPAGLVRARLAAKLPPVPLSSARPSGPVVECATCRAPGRPEALRDGECGSCRGEPAPVRHPAALPPDRVRALAAEARSAASTL